MVGEIVYIKDKNNIDLLLNADGTISASISGGTVRILSGDTVNVIVRNIAGLSATVAGLDVDDQSNQPGVGPNALVTMAAIVGSHLTNTKLVRINAVSPVSGAGNRLLVSMSGDTVALAAGTSIIANTSGSTIRLTNDGLNNVVKVSGENVYSYGATPRANALVVCTNLSGGTNLPNLACVKLFVRSISGNDVMYIGGTGAQAPWSGTGLELYGGEMMPLEVSNANVINIFAATSGQRVSVFAIDK